MSNRKILVVGAGRSATVLIHYLLDNAAAQNWHITIADADIQLALSKINNHSSGTAAQLNVTNAQQRNELVKNADIVISLLPPALHIELANDCLQFKKHLITASYVSKEIKALDQKVKENNLIFMCEMGLDPGIDHLSAMQKIDEIKAQGGELHSFKSFTGGLVAPESDNNPWHYKISWNPRNVVLAGQGVAQYLDNYSTKFIPYNRLFKEYEIIKIPQMGDYEGYANRDSLSYRQTYRLENIPTILRGTLRHSGFCDAWHALVKLGYTDNTFEFQTNGMTYAQLTASFLNPNTKGNNIQEKVKTFLADEATDDVMFKLAWLGIFDDFEIQVQTASPAVVLEQLMLKKWVLNPEDKDMIIMQHEFIYTLSGKKNRITSTLVLKGHDAVNTAMAALVGLPLGIFAKLLFSGNVNRTGVLIPVDEDIYKPVLNELAQFGVRFIENHEIIN